jgi:hypothetical protein
MFVGRMFESYKEIELHIDTDSGKMPRVQTYFPLTKERGQSKGVPSIAPAAAAAGTAYTVGYTVSYEEEQQESDFGGFDF